MSSHDRLPALDGLRGLAILLVLAVHFGTRLPPTTPAQEALFHVASVGWSGVDLFFVLSGFLITGILYDARGKPGYLRSFYVRRILRIFPLHYLFVAGYVILLPLLVADHPGTSIVLDHQHWWWAYASNIWIAWHDTWDVAPLYTSPMWSLAVEEQFYLLWPFFLLLVPRGHDVWCLVLFVGAVLTRIVVCVFGWDDVAPMVLMPARMDALALGGWLALVGRQQGLQSLARLTRIVSVTGAVLAVALFMNPRPESNIFMTTLGFSFVALFFAGVVLSALIYPVGIWGRIGHARVMQWFGRYSYGIYIWHCPVRLLLDELALSPRNLAYVGVPWFVAVAIFAVLGIGLTLVLAVLSWHFFEAPILSLKRFFPYESADEGPAKTGHYVPIADRT